MAQKIKRLLSTRSRFAFSLAEAFTRARTVKLLINLKAVHCIQKAMLPAPRLLPVFSFIFSQNKRWTLNVKYIVNAHKHDSFYAHKKKINWLLAQLFRFLKGSKLK